MTITIINTLHSDLGFDSDAYRLVKKIGQGGFGQVYLAKQLNTNQDVAIKFLSVSSDFDQAKKQRYIERFDRETLLCSRLQHPNIVRLLDKGACKDNLLYAVFEYVDGKTLRQTLTDDGPLLPVDAAEVMGQVLDALAHAHEQGVIHRDVKPANIMLTKVGAKMHAKVLDFGIGTLVNEVRQLDYKSITLTQETLGTPSYSAPEQLRGEPPTPKTDIYVWGLVFIECLTGQAAISGSSLAAVFHKQLSQSNVPLPTSLAGHSVAAFLRRVLNKKANERAADAADLYNEFTQLNFSTLVGQLNDHAKHDIATDNTLLVQPGDNETLINETLINDLSAVQTTYASLTERKQISALAVRLNIKAVTDGELDDEVIDAIHRDQKAQCVDVAIRYGAFHVGTLGDTLLFYFGYPAVSDNDSRLCARTALEISSKLNQRNSLLKQSQGIELLAHMGLHTGVVTVYADATPEGDTANITLELARLAASNQILTTQLSKSLLDSYLVFNPQQAANIGINFEQKPLYALLGERQVEAFGFLRANKSNNVFIGREQELAHLQLMLADNKTHQSRTNGRCAHVFGEAGIGKSRLVFELRNLARGFTHYVAQCLPEHKNNALYPVLNLVKYKYSLDVMAPEVAVGKLHRELLLLEDGTEQASYKSQDALAILSSWLALPLPEDIEVKAFSPDVQKQILFNALINLLLSEYENKHISKKNKQRGALFLFEDIHWADPTSLEFIAALSKNNTETNDVFICTSRQPLPETLIENGFDIIELMKLNQQKTTEFVLNLFEKKNVSAKLLDVVVARTDGIPLFIEELINMLKQKGLIQHLNGITDFVNPDNINEVPSSLRESLQQKLDTLVYAKETAQLAATIGREFNYDLLAAASNHSEAQLQIDLNELIEADLIILQRKVAGDSYIFKHALVRDAACESMLDSLKTIKHQKVAQSIVNLRDVTSDDVIGLLAYHYKNGGVFDQAAHYAQISAENAMGKSLYVQSIFYAKDALESLKSIGGSVETRLEVNQILTTASMMVSGWASPEVEQLINESSKLLQDLGNEWSDIKFQVHWALATYNNVRGYHGEVANLITSVLNEKQVSSGDKAALIALQAHSFWQQGKLQDGLRHTEEALALYQPNLHGDHAAKFGHDTKVFALGLQAMIYSNTGDFEKSHRDISAAEKYAYKLSSHHSVCMAKLYKCVCLYHERLPEQIKVTAKEILDICHQEGIGNWIDLTTVLNDWAISFDPLGHYSERPALALNNMISVGMTQLQGFWNAMVVEAQMNHGKFTESLSRLHDCLNHSRKYDDGLCLPILQRLIGQCYEKLGNQKDEMKFYQLALDDALRFGMKDFHSKLQIYTSTLNN